MNPGTAGQHRSLRPVAAIPGTYGHLEDISPLVEQAHQANALVAVAADIMATAAGEIARRPGRRRGAG